MDPVMYILMDRTPMSEGKARAQAAHAAVEAYLISDQNKQAVNRWRCGGHYKKIVLMADDLAVAERYINDRGFKTAAIIDEGRTEFTADLTLTAIGVEILDKDVLHVRETFNAFKLFALPPETDDELAERIEKLREVDHYSLSPRLRVALFPDRPTVKDRIAASRAARMEARREREKMMAATNPDAPDDDGMRFSDYGYP